MPYAANALSVKIADQLTEMISKRRFQPGDKLPNELELAEELQVSRTTLREALRILSTRGLVEAMRKHGVTAAQTAMLGDKLLTDTLSAKRGGVIMLMVEPKGGPLGAWNHVLHAMQEPFKRACGRDQRQ